MSKKNYKVTDKESSTRLETSSGAIPASNDVFDQETKTDVTYDLSSTGDVWDMIFNKKSSEDIIKNNIMQYIEKLKTKYNLTNYKIIFLYDRSRSISQWTADQIYSSLLPEDNDKDLLLVINSAGGEIEPAYLISKCCKEYSQKFIITIPRRAKSAATLLSFGADEIHMGIMSELGPIDPQISGWPALGLRSALVTISKMVTDCPDSYLMFSEYLAKKLDLGTLGYFERVTESAAQYAERLLDQKEFPENRTASDVAKHFVYTYRDHSFVIDKDEATRYLGNLIKTSTPEYYFGRDIHSCLDSILWLLDISRQRDFSFCGNSVIFFDKK